MYSLFNCFKYVITPPFKHSKKSFFWVFIFDNMIFHVIPQTTKNLGSWLSPDYSEDPIALRPILSDSLLLLNS